MAFRSARALPVASLLLALFAVPGVPASAATVTSVHYVPTQLPDGTQELIRVEIQRDDKFDGQGQGVLGTMSPYNLTPTGTGVGAGMSSQGIASAKIDVLGTRGSTGCWNYGGRNEAKAGVDAVRFLAGDIPDKDGKRLTWSNGRVGLTGVSYDGTTANMVAAAPRSMWTDSRGSSIDADGTTPLKAIVPVAAISRWYGYAYAFGLRMTDDGESTSPADEDILTPIAFDLGFGLTAHSDQPAAAAQRGCGTVLHTQEAYTRNPDYDAFWLERDYTVTAKDWTTNTLIVHGWNDYNVKQYEATRLYEALAPYASDPTDNVVGDGNDRGFDLRMWMTQSRHANGNGDGYATLRDNFLKAHLLEGAAARAAAVAVAKVDNVRSLGETTAGAAKVTFSETWPLEGTRTHSLFLNRTYEQDLNCTPACIPGPGTGEVGELSYTNRFSGPLAGRSGSYGPTSGWLDTGVTGEEVATKDPWSNDGQKLDKLGGQGYYSLAFSTTPLTRDVQIAGSAVLEGYYNFIRAEGAGLTPVLVDISPTDTYKVVQRGFLNTDYRNGLSKSAGPASGWVRADVTFFPEDYTVPKGHRLGVIVTSSNSVWTVPGTPAGFVSVGLAPKIGGLPTETGTALHLPLVGVQPDERVFTDWPSAK